MEHQIWARKVAQHEHQSVGSVMALFWKLLDGIAIDPIWDVGGRCAYARCSNL